MHDRYYKLAVYGDSYADSGPPESEFFYQSYYNRLSQMLSDNPTALGEHHGVDEKLYYENYGSSGASPYWAYINFKNCLVDLNYVVENAVMVFSDTQRLPIATKEHCGMSWKNLFRVDKIPMHIDVERNIEGKSPSKSFWEHTLKTLSMHPPATLGGYDEADVFSLWNLFFEDNYYHNELTKLISLASFTKSIELAKERNVNLVVIIPFDSSMSEYLGEDPDPKITDNLMIITGLDKVSHMETRTFDNCSSIDPCDPKVMNNDFFKIKTAREVRWKNNHVDVRCNHLCGTNNQVLTDLIWKGFQGQTGIYDLSEQPGLNFDEIGDYADLIYDD